MKIGRKEAHLRAEADSSQTYQTKPAPNVTAAVNRSEQARFSTDLLVTHTSTEFRVIFFDTWLTQPGAMPNTFRQNKDVVAEVVASPAHFKSIVKAFADNLAKYEGRFGEVKMPQAKAGQEAPATLQTGTEGSESYG